MGCGRRAIVRALVALSAAGACVSAASCATLSRPAPDRTFFAIDPGTPPRAASPVAPQGRAPTTSPGEAVLRVRGLRVAAPYDGRALVYRMPGDQFRTDYYNGFIADPAELLTQELVEWLSKAGVAGSVVGETSVVPARFVLEGTVTALYGDYTNRPAPQAVVALRIRVLDDSQGRIVLQKEYTTAVPIEPASAASLVKGWGGALHRVLNEITSDLATMQQSPPPSSTDQPRG